MNINNYTKAQKAEMALLGRLSYEDYLEATEQKKTIGTRGKYNFAKFVVGKLYVDFSDDDLLAMVME